MLDNPAIYTSILLFILGFAIILIKWLSTLTFPHLKLPYKRKYYLITKPEKDLFRNLEAILGNKYRIFPQINLDKLVYTTSNKYQRLFDFRRMNQKSVDFVICDNSLKPLCAIELDDRSHLRADRIKRDKFVNQIFQDTEFPLLRLKPSTAKNPKELAKQIHNILNPPTSQIL